MASRINAEDVGRLIDALNVIYSDLSKAAKAKHYDRFHALVLMLLDIKTQLSSHPQPPLPPRR